MKKRSTPERRQKQKSPFTTYCMTTVACILLCACGFTFLMFGTDSMFTPSGINRQSANVDLPVSFERTIREIEKEENTSNGTNLGNAGTTTGDPSIDDDGTGGGNKPYTPGIGQTLTLSADGAKVAAVLRGLGYDDQRSDQLGYLFDKLKTAGYPDEFCIGMISNQCHEARVGQLQGSGVQMATRADVDALLNGSKGGGIGMVQWTSKGRRDAICNKYIAANAFNADGSINVDIALNVECDFILEELQSYKPYEKGLAEGGTTARDFSEAVHDNYEVSKYSCANQKYGFMCFVKGENPYGKECESRCNTAEQIVAGLNGGN